MRQLILLTSGLILIVVLKQFHHQEIWR